MLMFVRILTLSNLHLNLILTMSYPRIDTDDNTNGIPVYLTFDIRIRISAFTRRPNMSACVPACFSDSMCICAPRLCLFVDTYDQQYWKTVGTLPLLNRINEIHSNEINSAKITSPHITFPELHNEVFPK